jgi:hypothetical protein
LVAKVGLEKAYGKLTGNETENWKTTPHEK